MRIKELVEKSGVPRTTIHYYLRQGVLHPPQKTGRTMAYYDNRHLRQLKEIQSLKKGGRVPITFLKKQILSMNHGNSSKSVNEYNVRRPVTTNKEKEKKRQEITKQAILIFSQKGYHQTKISDITSSLRISTGTFYIYFKNKQDLFIEVIDDVFRNIVGEAAIALKGEDDFLERLKIRAKVFYKEYTKYSEILSLLRAEMASEDKWPAEKIQRIYHGLTKPVIREIEVAINRGIIKKINPDLLGYSLVGLVEIMSLRLFLDKKYDLNEIFKFMMDLTIIPLMQNDENRSL